LLPRRSQLHAVLQLNCMLYYSQASCTVSSSTGCSYRKHHRYRPPCLHTPANEEYQMHKIRLKLECVPAATPAVTPAATDPGGLLHQQLSLCWQLKGARRAKQEPCRGLVTKSLSISPGHGKFVPQQEPRTALVSNKQVGTMTIPG
jgi:hypothetical protein